MDVSPLHRTAYSTGWKKLLNKYDNRPVLWELMDHEMGKGKFYMIDSTGPAPDIDQRVKTDEEGNKDLADKKNRSTFEKLAQVDQTLAEFKELIVPHNDYTKLRTQSKAKLQDTGHWLDPDEDILHCVNPQGYIMESLATDMKAQADHLCFTGITAETVTRYKADDETPVVQNLSASNPMLTVPTGVGTFGRQVFSAIRRRFMEKGLFKPRKLYCMISPADWEKLVNSEVEIMMNKDYVDPAQHFFEQGFLPSILGIQIIEHPDVVEGEFWSWRKEAVVGVDYGNAKEYIHQSPEFKNQIIMYKAKNCDVKPVDDNARLKGHIVAA